MTNLIESELYDGISLKITKDKLKELIPFNKFNLDLIDKADKVYIKFYPRYLEIMGYWNGDPDCILSLSNSSKYYDIFKKEILYPYIISKTSN